MWKHFAIAVALFMLVAQAASAAPPSSAEKGLGRACERASSNEPCERLGIIPDTTVAAGSTRTYENGTFRAEGDVHVFGTVVVDNATIRFGPESSGFTVFAGGHLIVKESTLEEGAEGSEFGIDAQLGSALDLTGSVVDGGSGVHLATDDATFAGNTLRNIPVALRNDGVSVRIHHNTFLGNNVSVNNTGGAPTLDNNTFTGGAVCVRDWLTDPTIVDNVFRGCHVGIFHHRSESVLSRNDMDDDGEPPGVGILVQDTMSPIIADNEIQDYGTGIIIRNARAFIRNNSIHHNVLDGILVDTNSAPMDIQGNHVFANGRHGIVLLNATHLPVFENDVHGNGDAGILVNVAGDDIVIDLNRVSGNRHGIVVSNAQGTHVQRNFVNATEVTAISVDAASFGVDVQRNAVHGATYGIFTEGQATALYYNEVASAAIGFRILGDGTTSFGDRATSGGDGLVIDAADGVIVELGEFNGNAGNGVAVITGGDSAFINVNASGNGAVGFYVSELITGRASLYGPRAMDNLVGVLTAGGDHAFAVDGWFEGNAQAGFRNDDPDVTISAERSYWGSPSGPTAHDNPGGTGDAVLGNVDWDPYRASPPPPWTPPTHLA